MMIFSQPVVSSNRPHIARVPSVKGAWIPRSNKASFRALSYVVSNLNLGKANATRVYCNFFAAEITSVDVAKLALSIIGSTNNIDIIESANGKLIT